MSSLMDGFDISAHLKAIVVDPFDVEGRFGIQIKNVRELAQRFLVVVMDYDKDGLAFANKTRVWHRREIHGNAGDFHIEASEPLRANDSL